MAGCSSAGGTARAATGGDDMSGDGSMTASGGSAGSAGANGGGGGGASGAGGAGGGVAAGGGGAVGSGGGGGGAGGSMTVVDGAAPRPDGAIDAGATSGRFVCPAGPFPSPIPVGAVPVRIPGVPPSDSFNMQNGTFGILEGPVWIGDALYLSEIGLAVNGVNPPPSRILKLTAAGAVSVAVADSGSNGLAVDASGNLFGAVHKDGSISRFDLSTGRATPIATGYGGARFDAPNDLAIRSDGNIYFSDTSFQAPPTASLPTNLYRIAPPANAVSIVNPPPNQQALPNGVTLSVDEKTLYVAWPSGIYKYPVADDGSLGAAVVVTTAIGSGDGMAIDCAGNLYVAIINTSMLVVVNPQGTELTRFTFDGVQSMTNAAFGGAERKTLFVTALGTGTQKALFKIDLGIQGLPY